MNFSYDQFLDLALLAGCSLSRSFPLIAETFSMRSAMDYLRAGKSGLGVCQGWAGQLKGSGYLESFMRARLAIKYSLVLTTDGACLPLPLVVPPPGQVVTPADVPSDLDEIFSPRLPDELYFILCRGMVSAQLVGYLASGIIDERQPLADSPEYRRFIKDIITEGATSPRCTTLALLTAPLHPQWAQKRIVSLVSSSTTLTKQSAHYYFDPSYAPPQGATVPTSDPLTQSLVDKCSTWMVPHHVLGDELRRQSVS